MEVDSHREHQKQDPQKTPQSNKFKCICQLCTCGKHHCPRPRIKGDFSTSYADHYQNVPPPQYYPPQPQYKYEQRHYNPEVLRTSYEDNYKDRPVANINPQSPTRFESLGNKIMRKVPFMGESSYKQQFKPFAYHQPNPEQQKLRNYPKVQNTPPYRSPIKFQGISSYKSQYIEPPKIMANSMIQPMTPPRRVNVPFYGHSSYKDQFPDYKFSPPVKQKSEELPSPNYRLPTVKFEGHTSYQDQFSGKAIQMQQYMTPQRQVHSPGCVVEKMSVPPVNYINNEKHIFYDPEQKKFV